MPDDSKQWSKLLQAIANGVVIPIVGRDLLRIPVDGREQLLYEIPREAACDPTESRVRSFCQHRPSGRWLP